MDQVTPTSICGARSTRNTGSREAGQIKYRRETVSIGVFLQGLNQTLNLAPDDKQQMGRDRYCL